MIEMLRLFWMNAGFRIAEFKRREVLQGDWLIQRFHESYEVAKVK